MKTSSTLAPLAAGLLLAFNNVAAQDHSQHHMPAPAAQDHSRHQAKPKAKPKPAMAATVRTMCHCHHSARSCAHCGGGL